METQTPQLSPAQQQGLEMIIARTVQAVVRSNKWNPNCTTCAFFREAEGEVCARFKPMVRPPARVIVKGCPSWSETPF